MVNPLAVVSMQGMREGTRPCTSRQINLSVLDVVASAKVSADPLVEAGRLGVLLALEPRDVALHGVHHGFRQIDKQAPQPAY